jgi:hypothetical protein
MSLFTEKVEGNYDSKYKVGNIIVACVLAVIIIYLFFFAFGFVTKAYERYQARLDAQNAILVQEQGRLQARLNAENEATLNEIKIKQQEQLIQVEKQKAEIRVQEALGIAKAQEIINATLTDKYLQHEAIQAQEVMASSPNHTTIYIPSGQNGIPLVKTLE